MNKERVRKAAWLSAAGTMAAAAVTGVAPTAAHASVTNSCGQNLNPTKFSSPADAEWISSRQEPNWGIYPTLELRVALNNGKAAFWARVQHQRQGELVMDWYKSSNSATHYKCEVNMSSYTTAVRYTPAITYGWNAYAKKFRPCELVSQSGQDGPWLCGWWSS
jgi:hypothetical protein